MVTFQKQDHHFIIARQATLEKEICKIIADGEESKIFIEPDTGLWFGGSPQKQIWTNHQSSQRSYPQRILSPHIPVPQQPPKGPSNL